MDGGIKQKTMKTRIFTLIAFAAIVLSTQTASAKIRRVGYFGTAVTGTDYADLQSAHDAANTGDTLLIFPGNYSATYTKKLVTIGYGYFISGSGSNAGLQNITGTLSISVTLDAHSDSCTFTGLDGLTVDETTGVSISNINVNRCKFNYIYFEDKTYTNWQITQCWIYAMLYDASTSKPLNLLVKNCRINYLQFATLPGQNGQFLNDVLDGGVNNFGNGAFMIINCIYTASAYHSNDGNCVYQYSISNTSSPIPTGNGNQNLTSTQFNKMFVNASSTDSIYALKGGSPAIGTGLNGVDCGMFGGSNPYRVSGIPAIPAFYQLTAPSNVTSSNPYTITFSVRSNN